MNVQDTLAAQVKAAIVRCLRMPIAPDEIQDEMPLFDQGLGLDSIDALEIVLELQRSFNVEIADEEVGRRVLRNVSTIVKFIETTPRNGGVTVRERLRNCLTVDVEEWFHVCGAGGPLAFQHWDTLPSRVVDTTQGSAGPARLMRRPRHVLRPRLGRRPISGARYGISRAPDTKSGRTDICIAGSSS